MLTRGTYLLDTCICIALIKQDPAVVEQIRRVGVSECKISDLTIGELYFGAYKSGRPEHFDDVYEGYNELQKEQGFDLSGHRGRKAELYTYEIYNYPDHPDCMQLTLIGEDGVLIGGDVCCTELDGFMQGLLPSDKDICENNNSDEEKTAVTETGSLDNDSSS